MLGLNLFSRKIFLEYLGDTLSGLVTTMQFTVGLLNMADIGISTAIIYALFQTHIRRRQGGDQPHNIVVLLPVPANRHRRGDSGDSHNVPYAFVPRGSGAAGHHNAVVPYIPRATSSLSYFVNYKQYLLSAYQRGYVIVRIFNITTITKMSVADGGAHVWLGGGYASFLILEVVAAVVYSWLLEMCGT